MICLFNNYETNYIIILCTIDNCVNQRPVAYINYVTVY